MPDLLDQLRDQKVAARAGQDAVLNRAAEEGRDLTGDELAEHGRHVVAEREAADAADAERDRQLAELLAAPARRPAGPVPHQPILSRGDSVYDWCHARGMFDAYDQADQPLSFDRYLKGMATGVWTGADHERALAEATVGAGGALVPAPLSARVIDLARAATRVFQAGAVTVPMATQTLAIPRLLTEGSPAWKSENAAITAADMTFDRVTFTARTLVRTILLSVELFEDSPAQGTASAEDVIARSFAAQMALELDRVALRGSGTAPEPRGILNQSGVTVTTHGANGSVIGSPPAAGTMGWEFLAQAVGVVRGNNFDPTAQIMAPRTPLSLGLLRDTTNQYVAPPTYLDGVTRLTTKQVPINLTVGTSSDTSEVYTGQFDQLLIGIRTDFNLRFLGERYLADNLQYAFLAYLRADVQLAQPTAFVVDTGVRG
jgi:HK97 family phage major capsid protein